MNLVTVYRGFDLTNAQMVRARLEAAEFHPFIADEFSSLEMGGISLSKQGVRVQVPEDEAADAKEFLASTDSTAE